MAARLLMMAIWISWLHLPTSALGLACAPALVAASVAAHRKVLVAAGCSGIALL